MHTIVYTNRIKLLFTDVSVAERGKRGMCRKKKFFLIIRRLNNQNVIQKPARFAVS